MHDQCRIYQASGKLSHLKLPEITEPFPLKILWIRTISSESDIRAVTKSRHKHSFFEAHFVLRGEVRYESECAEYTLDENCAILFPPEYPHTVRSLTGDFLKISVAFSTESDVFAKDSAVFLKSAVAVSDFEAIIRTLEEKPPFYSYIIRDRIFAALSVFMQDKKGDSINDPEVTESIAVALAKRYIEDNVHLFLTCEDVARYCHFNPKYLGRLFKAQTGQTMLTFIHSVKSRAAESMLEVEETPLSEISAALGFENEYYFNTFFKRINGITPGTYRRLICKSNK